MDQLINDIVDSMRRLGADHLNTYIHSLRVDYDAGLSPLSRAQIKQLHDRALAKYNAGNTAPAEVTKICRLK